MPETEIKDTISDPPWWQELTNRFESGTTSCFGLHGNVADYVGNNYQTTLRYYLSSKLAAAGFQVVCFYDIARGMVFADEIIALGKDKAGVPIKTMRPRFKEIIGADTAQKPPTDPRAAALQAAAQAARQAQGGDDEGNSPADILPLLGKMLRQGKKVAAIIDHADVVVGSGDKAVKSLVERQALVQLVIWGTDAAVIDNNCMVILISPALSDIHPDLRAARNNYAWLDIPLPGEPQRLEYITWALERAKQRGDVSLDENLSPEQFAAATAGLAKSHLENIVLLAKNSEPPVVTRELVKARKAEIISTEFQDVIAFLEPNGGMSLVGGHERIKKYLQMRVVDAIARGERDMVPTGILFLGPPGTGKTMMASALAFDSGFNSVQIRPDLIFSKWVGESERNLERLLTCLKAMAPVIAFIDEIDQKFQRGQGDGNQVNNNVFGRMLEFISLPSNKGQIVFIAASNKPELIDPALMRSGRFGVRVPFLPPDPDERADIFRRSWGKYNYTTPDVVDQRLLARTEGWTGAEIAELIADASFLARYNRQPFTVGHLMTTLDTTVHKASDYDGYIARALDATRDLALLPESWQKKLKEQNQPKPVLQNFESDDFNKKRLN